MEPNKQLTGSVQLWKNAFAKYKEIAKSLAPFLLVGAAFNLFYAVTARHTTTHAPGQIGFFSQTKVGGPPFILFALYSLFLLALIAYRASGQDQKTAVSRALKKFLPLLLTIFLFAIGIGFGFILLIVPGVLLLVWASQTLFAIMFEDKGISAAFTRSKELVHGRFWEVLGRLLFPILPSIAVSLLGAFGLPGGVLSALLSSLLVSPIALIYSYLLYQNLSKPQ